MPPVYKIAIVGATSLRGKELKEALLESPLADAHVDLLDEGEGLGKIEQLGEEATFVQRIDADSFERVDFAFFADSEETTHQYWRAAQKAGATVIDLSGALDQEPRVVIRAPWVGQGLGSARLGAVANLPDLYTPATVSAHPAAVTLALLMDRIQLVATVRLAAATVLEPASEYGRAGMDELHQQTVSLLSFQNMPKAVYDAQAAYNTLTSFGEAAPVALGAAEARIRRHYAALAGSLASLGQAGRRPGRLLPDLAVQLIHAPVFHGHTASILVDLERPVSMAILEDALGGEHLDLILEDTDAPSNLAAAGQNDVMVRIRTEDSMARENADRQAQHRSAAEASRFWLWVATDNLRISAQNAVECALDLRRLRPQGTVQ